MRGDGVQEPGRSAAPRAEEQDVRTRALSMAADEPKQHLAPEQVEPRPQRRRRPVGGAASARGIGAHDSGPVSACVATGHAGDDRVEQGVRQDALPLGVQVEAVAVGNASRGDRGPQSRLERDRRYVQLAGDVTEGVEAGARCLVEFEHRQMLAQQRDRADLPSAAQEAARRLERALDVLGVEILVDLHALLVVPGEVPPRVVVEQLDEGERGALLVELAGQWAPELRHRAVVRAVQHERDDVRVEEPEPFGVRQAVDRSPAPRGHVAHEDGAAQRLGQSALEQRGRDLGLVHVRAAVDDAVAEHEDAQLVGIGLLRRDLATAHRVSVVCVVVVEPAHPLGRDGQVVHVRIGLPQRRRTQPETAAGVRLGRDDECDRDADEDQQHDEGRVHQTA